MPLSCSPLFMTSWRTQNFEKMLTLHDNFWRHVHKEKREQVYRRVGRPEIVERDLV